jgi:hypothetical protein
LRCGTLIVRRKPPCARNPSTRNVPKQVLIQDTRTRPLQNSAQEAKGDPFGSPTTEDPRRLAIVVKVSRPGPLACCRQTRTTSRCRC